MLAMMLYRGPDGSGTWAGSGLALGHLRLGILDPTDRARQPMASAGGEGVLAYNGEVYNYRELRAQLEREGATFTSSGDTEVVLQALQRWGPRQAIPRFNGMFAFAYFDVRERELWLARDRLGIKPLYFAESGAELIFASEPQAVLAHPQLQCRPDRLAIASFILRGRPDPRLTLFEGVESMEPGTWWRVSAGGTERHRYFRVPEALDIQRLVAPEASDVVAHLEGLLDESVRLHLASDVPLAAICSGGVDSSLIAALACRHRQDLDCYVADVAGDRGEGDAAQRVTEHLGLHLTRLRIDRETHLGFWPEAVWHDGHPCQRRSSVALLVLARGCHAAGVKVLLNGEGSDELFGGYGWYEEAYAAWGWRARLGRALDFSPAGRRARRDGMGFDSLMALPGVVSLGARGLAAIDGDTELRRRALFEKLAPVRSDADRAFLFRCFDDLYTNLDPLLRRHDRMAMAASIEMRVPFLESAIIDFGIHLPRRSKLRHGQRKWVVKQVAQKLLPAEIVHARKRAFPIPGAFDVGSEVLLHGGVAGELLRWSRVTQQAVTALAAHDEDLRFALVGLELWGRLYLRGEKPDALAGELLALA
jgi:asparagine synthase (glutamine-hydrolysing)